jgi:hypothetical protein
MTSGDCLVIERDDGRFDVFKIATNGAHLPVHRNISDSHTDWGDPDRRGEKASGGTADVIQYQSSDESLRPVVTAGLSGGTVHTPTRSRRGLAAPGRRTFARLPFEEPQSLVQKAASPLCLR